MRASRLAWLCALALSACSNGNTSTNPPMTTPTTGGIAGTATLDGMTAGNAGIAIAVLGGATAATDDAGNWAIGNLAPGAVTVQATYPGYMPAMTTVTVTAGSIATASPLTLTKLKSTPMGGVSGRVFLFDTSAAAGSMVTLSSNGGTAMSAADGSWSIANVPAGVYTATFAHAGYVSQTVANVIVPASGTVTVADVTLRRDTTIINGHTITRLGPSPDRSLQLLAVDGKLEVASEATGAVVPVAVGTDANNGALANDDKHLYVSDGNGLLWVGTTDGRSLSLVTAKFGGFALFTADGAKLLFEAQDAQGNDVISMVSTSGGAPTVVSTNPINGDFGQPISGTLTGLAIYDNSGTDGNGYATVTAHYVDLNSGNVTTIDQVLIGSHKNHLGEAPSYELFSTSLGTQPSTTISIGELYLWKPGTAPVALTGGTSPIAAGTFPVNAAVFIDFLDMSSMAWLSFSNFDTDNTFAFHVVDANAGVLRGLIAHASSPGVISGFPFGNQIIPPFGFPRHWLETDMHDAAGTYSYDIVDVDYLSGTRTVVQPNAARLPDGPALANENIGNYIQPQFTNTGIDFAHMLLGDSRSATTAGALMNWSLYDGLLHHLNPPAAPIPSDTVFKFSNNWRVAAYATLYSPPTANATPLTIVDLPPPGTAGNGMPVHTAPAFFPPGGALNVAFSTDTSTAAFINDNAGSSEVYKMPTAPSAAPVTPTRLLTADPNGTSSLTWVALSGKGDLAFVGDQVNAATNAWVVTAAGTATPLDAATFGTSRPGVFAIADGARTFVTDESGDNFLVQVDTAATPALTRIDNYALGSAQINLPSTRFFYQDTSAPALTWSTSTASGTVDGTWTPYLILPPFGVVDTPVSYFTDGAKLDAFDGAAGVTALAVDTVTSASYSLTEKSVLVVDQDANGVNHLISSPATAPARNVIADGYPSTGTPPLTNTPDPSGFYSADWSTLYVWGDANAGTANPQSWTLGTLALSSNTVGTLGTSLDPASFQFSPTQKYAFFHGVVDPQLATATYYTAAVGGAVGVKQSDDVLSVSYSVADGAAFSLLLPDGTSHVVSAAAGGTGKAFTASTSTNVTLTWSGDGARLFATDNTNGNGYGSVYGGAAGGDGTLYDTESSAAMPDFSGANLLTIAQHPSDPGVVVDHASIQ